MLVRTESGHNVPLKISLYKYMKPEPEIMLHSEKLYDCETWCTGIRENTGWEISSGGRLFPDTVGRLPPELISHPVFSLRE